MQWWQERVVYQIYPRSFKDHNKDGVGDLQGIIEKLDYLKALGIGIIWLCPIYCSPNVDYGYDISDYKNINPEYGTMEDFEELIEACQKRDIFLIMDLVINHTSDQHPWFCESRDPESPYRDYYFWLQGKDQKPPNNWTSFFAEDCWVYDDRSNAWYLHLFAKQQPDLNYHNPAVLEKIKDIMRFWLDKGARGFRCDVINVIYKESLANGKRKLILTGSEHYLSRPGMHIILKHLNREVLSQYDCFTVGETVFITPQVARDLCAPERNELNMVFSFEHMETDQYIVKWFKRRFHAGRLARALAHWQKELDWNANYLENHDQPRSVSRFGDDSPRYWQSSAKVLATLLLTLRGTPFIYQGEEIGMTNFDYTSMEQIRDVESRNVDRLAKKLGIPKKIRWNLIRKTSRDNARTPMQWSDEPEAGFSGGTPWIDVHHNYHQIHVAQQEKDPDSILNYYRTLIRLRANHPALLSGDFLLVEGNRKRIVFERSEKEEKLTILLSFSKKKQRVHRMGPVLLSSSGRLTYDGILLPYEAVILRGETS